MIFANDLADFGIVADFVTIVQAQRLFHNYLDRLSLFSYIFDRFSMKQVTSNDCRLSLITRR
jgi:hypothetical protein